MSQTKAAEHAGCAPRTVRRYVRCRLLRVDEKKRVNLMDLEDFLDRSKPGKRGRKVGRSANPLIESLRVNDQGQMFLMAHPIFAWDGSGNAMLLKGKPCSKGSFTIPHPEDIEPVCRVLEIRLFAHLRIEAERIIRCGLNSAMLADHFLQEHSKVPFLLFQTPRQVTEQNHHVIIRQRSGYVVEITTDESGKTIREQLVTSGNELGTLLPLAYQLDQALAGCSAYHIRVLTALFICDVLRHRKPDGRRYCATKAQREEREHYWKIHDLALSKPPSPDTPINLKKLRRALLFGEGAKQTPQQQQMWEKNMERRMNTKFMRRLGGVVHEGITRHGYTLEWMLKCSRPTALYWRRKLSPLLKKVNAVVNDLRRPQVSARPSRASEKDESIDSYLGQQTVSLQEHTAAIKKARTPRHIYTKNWTARTEQ